MGGFRWIMPSVFNRQQIYERVIKPLETAELLDFRGL